MRSLVFAWLCLSVLSFSVVAARPNSIADQSTHEQSGVIEMPADASSLPINAFCLNSDGNILAACGKGPGEVRVISQDGEIMRSWEVDIKPESIAAGDDGEVFVGGDGKLFRFDAGGDVICKADSPHAIKLRSSDGELREVALESLNRRRDSLGSRVKMYRSMIEQLKEREEEGELSETEKRTYALLPRMLERYEKQLEERGPLEDNAPTEEEIASQVESLMKSKMRISSISANTDHVFVATRGIAGYGYDIWKMDDQFASGEIIVSGLSGCCGQMDAQCNDQGIFVAENSRGRVVHYDFEGNEVTKWGKKDRAGLEGFGSCCNPMNVCFDKAGNVYTAEASLGRIKRFNSDGDRLSFVGDVDLVPGCKNVSIAVSDDGEKVFMLDLTRNHIKVMSKRSEQDPSEPETDESAAEESVANAIDSDETEQQR